MARVAALERLVDVGRGGTRHIGVNAEQLRCCLYTHGLCDGRTPVAALRHKPGVSEALHQRHPGTCDTGGIPASDSRLTGEPVTRQRGITKWNASAPLAPCAVGLVSGSMIFSCSMTEPGHPCVTISGSASSCWERTWMK